jgi:ribosome recycling factor
MAFNFTNFKVRAKEIEDWLGREYLSIRTGKASPLLLDTVMVESYGTKQPIKHLAAIVIEDAKTLRITPWDKSSLKSIETAIVAANLGVSTSPDSNGIRVIFPDLTTERRAMLVKLIGTKLEEARITLRKERDKVWNEIQNEERAGNLSEDDKFRTKGDLQKIVDETNAKLEQLAEHKEREIMN